MNFKTYAYPSRIKNTGEVGVFYLANKRITFHHQNLNLPLFSSTSLVNNVQ